MASVDIRYHNTTIYESSNSFTIKLNTMQKYCDDDIKIIADLSQVPVDDLSIGTATCEVSNTLSIHCTRSNFICYGTGNVPFIVKTTDPTLGSYAKYYKNGLWWILQDVTVSGEYTIISGVSGVTAGDTFKWICFNNKN